MKHCPYCAKSVDDHVRWCPFCGQSLMQSQEPVSNDTTPFVPTFDSIEETASSLSNEADLKETDQELQTLITSSDADQEQEGASLESATRGVALEEPIPIKLTSLADTAIKKKLTLHVKTPHDQKTPRVKTPHDQTTPRVEIQPEKSGNKLVPSMQIPQLTGRQILAEVEDLQFEPGDLHPKTIEPAGMKKMQVDLSTENKKNDAYDDTQIDIKPLDEKILENPGQVAAPITFTAVNLDSTLRDNATGAAPLIADEFRRSETDPTVRTWPLEQMVALPEIEGDSSGKEDRTPLFSLKSVETNSLNKASEGLAWLNRVLCMLTILSWIGLALLLAIPYLSVLSPLIPIWRMIPILDRFLPIIPGGLTLICTLVAAATRYRAEKLLLKTTFLGTFLKMLVWFLIAGLPGIGLIAGLLTSILFLVKHRPAMVVTGLLLFFYTLVYQGYAALILKDYFS